jgi:alginate O-acetyltransferase complex protein AlgI
LIFNRIAYFLFFLFPCAILFRIVRPDLRPWICTSFGAAFFIYFSVTELAGWPAAACLLILIWEAFFSRLYAPGSRYCIAGIGIAIGVLAVFKYWNFFTGLLTAPLGYNPWFWPGQFLPLGVSFFTFEFIHYAADRYQGKVERGTLRDYFAFILFFPTMVAGPIKRYQSFVPKLHSPSTDWTLDWNRGVTRILTGLVKKFAGADLLTSVTVHLNAADISQATRPVLALWIVAYGWKIYFDFAGYSDIAIGSARLFGIAIPENFDWPYFRQNISEFWRHWHISLYRWLVDYVFIPLGGSRGSLVFLCRNILLLMLASGLWHGAASHFVLWGLYHGGALATHRVFVALRRRSGRAENSGMVARISSWALTYAIVTLAWPLFAMDTTTALLFYRRLLWL